MIPAGSYLVSNIIRLAIAAAVSLFILALLIFLVSTGHDPVERPRIVDLVSNTAVSGVLTYLALQLMALVTRAVRYQTLIAAADEPDVPGLGTMTLVTGVRNMMVDMLPGRLGELVYVALLNRGFQVSAAACLSSLAIGVLFDFIALGIIILGAIVWHLGGQGVDGWLIGALLMAGVAIIIAYTGLVYIVPWTNQQLKKLISATSPRLLQRVSTLLSELSEAIAKTRRSAIFVKVLTLSLVIRLLKYSALYTLFLAVVQHSLPAIADTSWIKVLAAIIGGEIGASLPLPTLMSFGTYEAGGTMVFSLLGLSEQDGLMSMLGVHIWSQVVDYSVGGICLMVIIFFSRPDQRITVGEINLVASQRWKRAAIYIITAAIVCAGIVALGWQFRANQKLGATTAPAAGEDMRQHLSNELEQSLLALSNAGTEGFIIWSSNRTGNHDILRMSLPDGKITAVTTDPHTETWPRISPDGSRIVFARSQQPWVSQRNAVAWDVLLLDLQTGDERLLARSASYPFWIDQDTVGYLQQGNQVMRHALSQDRTVLHYRSGESNSMPAGAAITSPDINPVTGELVFTARQSDIGAPRGFWGTALWQNKGAGPGPIVGVHEGCELNWSSNGQWLYQVGHGGKQEIMFYRINPETLESQPLLDLPGDYSHEYWPEDSNDGQYLVFGASKGDHEHDVADYEIFLWQIGRPGEQAMRLTFHSGNDNWPDIFIHRRE